MQVEFVEPECAERTTIRVAGLARAVTLMQITDSHLAWADDRDPDTIETRDTIEPKFRSRSPINAAPIDHFRETLAEAVAMGVDAVVLTGDIIHCPSWASVERLAELCESLACPFLYTPGNHDWDYPGQPWNDATREAYYPRFASLTDGSPAQQVIEVGGVRLIGIDNSNYQATAEQVAFVAEQLATGDPCMLFMHIPMFLATLTPSVLDRWSGPIMMGAEGWPPGQRERWHVPATRSSTRDFIGLLTDGPADNLLAIFTGHVHFAHADLFREGRYHYTTKPGYEGGYRIVRVEPQ